MKTIKIIRGLLNDDDKRYLKKLPAYKLRKARDRAGDIYSGMIGYYENLYGDDYVTKFGEDGTVRQMMHLVAIINAELELRNNKQPNDRIEQQALIAFYNDEKIPRGKGNPSKLYIRFGYYKHQYNRIGPEDSPVKNKNKVELFNKVISKLSGEAKIKAEKDLSELSKNIIGHVYFEKDLKTLNI